MTVKGSSRAGTSHHIQPQLSFAVVKKTCPERTAQVYAAVDVVSERCQNAIEMAEARATTVRFSEPMYGRLEHAGEVTGLPINSIVVIACLEWLDAHEPMRPPGIANLATGMMPALAQGATLLAPPRTGVLRRPFYPFDRFTERAKQALMAANDEADLIGQPHIADGHLLLGLLRDDQSIAGTALKAVGLTAEAVRQAIRESAPSGRGILGRGIPTADTKRVVEDAFKIARAAGDSQVGTRAILLALLDNPKNQTSNVLARVKITADQVKAEVERVSRETAPDAD
jgi:hypothetical protein